MVRRDGQGARGEPQSTGGPTQTPDQALHRLPGILFLVPSPARNVKYHHVPLRREFEYDVALSYAGENRAYVKEVAELLESADVRVFYDEYERATLWGQDLYTRLDDVYQHKAEYCVIFISRFYRDKLWTNHELRSAQARAFQGREEYILPARFDDTEIPGILPTVSYIDLWQTTQQELVELILTKLGRASLEQYTPSEQDALSEHTANPTVPPYRLPRMVPQNFNPYNEALDFISQLSSELKQRCDGLAHEGVSATVFDRESKRCLRVVARGQAVYSLNVWMGGLGNDDSLGFLDSPGPLDSPISDSMIGASAKIVWDRQTGRSMLDVLDMGLFGFPRRVMGERLLTPDELIEALWEKICNAIEETA